MKKTLLLFGVLISTFSFSQITTNSNWTWMNGDKNPPLSGNVGERYGHLIVNDNNGNVYMFGGAGNASSGKSYRNTLYKFNYSSNSWILLRGGTPQFENNLGIYGVQGVPSSTNDPGARAFCEGWIDNTGNLWIFGGFGYGELPNSTGMKNEISKYNPNTNQWTWVWGDNSGPTYGTKGVTSSTNKIGRRQESAFWKDNNNNFWIYGGRGASSNSSDGILSDLWKYDPSTNQWTWVWGSDVLQSNPYCDGTGNESALNEPGPRKNATASIAPNGKVYLFGGEDNNTYKYISSLYIYNPNTNLWNCQFNSTSREAYYGVQGVASSAHKPGGRKNSYSWLDNAGNFWLFGGYGYGESQGNWGGQNDLWQYDIVLKKWVWIKGSKIPSQFGIYGTLGIPSSLNNPGGRDDFAGWIDNSKNLWIFGGDGYGESVSGRYLNDLWKLGVDPLPMLLGNFDLKRLNNTINLIWTTSNELNSKNFEVERSIDGKNFNAIGTVEAEGFASDYSFIDVKPFVGLNYYRLKMVDKDGKFEYSEIKTIKFGNSFKFEMYPNPAKSTVNILVDKLNSKAILIITNIYGKQLYNQLLNDGNNVININSFSKGIYLVNITTDESVETKKLIIDK